MKRDRAKFRFKDILPNIGFKKPPNGVEDCIPCAVYPLSCLGNLTGVINIQGVCHHIDAKCNGQKFYTSFYYYILLTFIVILLTGSVGWYLYKMVLDWADSFKVFQSLAEIFYCFNGIAIVVGSMLKTKTR